MTSADAATIHAVAEALRRAVNGSDVDGILACWAEDGIMLPPSHSAVRGRTAIGEYFTRVFAARQLTFTFTESSMEVAGDLAIERLPSRAISPARRHERTSYSNRISITHGSRR